MTRVLHELVARRDLLYILVWRELIVTAGIVVKFAFASASGEKLAATDIATVAVKAVPWAFFVASLRFATNSLVANRELVTKVYLPRQIFPVASVLSQFVDFGIATVVLAVVLTVLRVGV